VTEMAAAARAVHFGARHEITSVFVRLHGAIERLAETRPTRAALKFRRRGKEWLAAARTEERAGSFLVIQRTCPGTLRAVLAQDVELARRKRRFPFLASFVHRERFVSHNVSLLQASRLGREASGRGRATAPCKGPESEDRQ